MTDIAAETPSFTLPQDSSSVSCSALDPSTPHFSQLPPEIREQIWLHTLSPRTIHLHCYTRETPIPKHELPWTRTTRRVRTKITALSFSAAEGPVGAGSFVYGRPKPNRSRWEDLHLRRAVPPGPVALFVCRESRAIALRHASYGTGFAGKNLVASGKNKRDKALVISADKWLGEMKKKRIWVDFERDEVVVDKTGNLTHAKEEIEKIRRLGVYRTENARGYSTVCDEMVGFLPLFIGLQELSLYLKLEEGDSIIVEDMEKSLVKELAQARERKKEEWLAELPVLKVVLYSQ